MYVLNTHTVRQRQAFLRNSIISFEFAGIPQNDFYVNDKKRTFFEQSLSGQALRLEPCLHSFTLILTLTPKRFVLPAHISSYKKLMPNEIK